VNTIIICLEKFTLLLLCIHLISLSLSQLSYEYTNIRMQPYSYEHITQFTPDIATDRVFQID
jgi:hypothetical protein